MTAEQYFEGIGRRKTATARVRLYPGGSGKVLVNDRPLEDYFPRPVDQYHLLEPLKVTETEGRFDITVKVKGGGMSGQAGAIRLGIARALLRASEDHREPLKASGFLTRDARKKERKKYGRKGARARFQFSKR